MFASDLSYLYDLIETKIKEMEKETGKHLEVVPDSVGINDGGATFDLRDAADRAKDTITASIRIDPARMISRKFLDEVAKRAIKKFSWKFKVRQVHGHCKVSESR